MQILVASNNAKKLRELKVILDGAGLGGVDVLPLDAVEDRKSVV